MHAEFLQQDRRGSRFISGRSISCAPVFPRNYWRRDAQEEATRTLGRMSWCVVERLGHRNKKGACLFLYLCAVAATGAFPHARDRTCTAIWTKSPNPISWTDRRTDERAGASKSWTARGTDNIDLGAPGPDAALIMHRRDFARKNVCAASYRLERLSSLKSRVSVKYSVNLR